MKFREGYGTIQTAKVPGTAARAKKPHVKELAASIKALGGEPAHMPIVDAANLYSMVAGRDRVAAMHLLGVETVDVRLVEGTPLELEALELSENLHRRRDDRDALIARFVAVTERMLAPTVREGDQLTDAERARGVIQAGTAAVTLGRPQTPRGKAREQVASALGIKPESVRAAEHREAKKVAPKVEPIVSSLGEAVDGYNEQLTTLLGCVRGAKGVAKALGEHPTLPTAAFNRIVQELDNLKFMVEACRLVAECPACSSWGEPSTDGAKVHGKLACALCAGFRVGTQFQLSGYVVEPKPIERLGAVVAPDDELEPVDDTEAF